MNIAILGKQAVRNIFLHPSRAIILITTIGITVSLSLAVLQASRAATSSLDSPIITEEHLTVNGKQKLFDATPLLDYLRYVPGVLRVISNYETRDVVTGTLVVGIEERKARDASQFMNSLPCRTTVDIPATITVGKTSFIASNLCGFITSPPRIYLPLENLRSESRDKVTSVEIVVPADIRPELSFALSSVSSLDNLTIIDSAVSKTKLLSLTRALRFNLSIMLALTFLIAALLIISAYRLASLERQKDYATLLALGVSVRTIFAGIVIESVALGSAGVLLGLTLGKPLADLGARYFLRSIAQQYTDASTAIFSLSGVQLAGSAVSGLTLACAGGGVVIWSILKLPLAGALRQGPGTGHRYAPVKILWTAVALTLCLLVGLCGALPIFPTASFGAALCAIVLSATLGPTLLALLPSFSRARTPAGQLSDADTAVAWQSFLLPLGAQSGALALCFGMGIMLSSFQTSLDDWINQTLRADLFIRDVRPSTPFAVHFLPDDALPILRKDSDVLEIIPFSFVEVKVDDVPLSVAGTTFVDGDRHRVFSLLSGTYSPQKLHFGNDALISETAARKLGATAGSVMTINGANIRVMGIYKDYSNEQGLVLIDLKEFQSLFDVKGIVSAAVYLHDPASATDFQRRYQRILGNSITLMTNRELRQSVNDIFTQTFSITTLLEHSTLALASLSFLLALLQIAAQRANEFKTLSALGFDRTIFFRYFLRLGLRISITALASGIVGGMVLGILLVKFVNPVSFGWTLTLSMVPAGVMYPIIALFFINVAVSAIVAGGLPRMLNNGVFRNE